MLPFTAQELRVLLVLGLTGLAGVTVPLVVRVEWPRAGATARVNLNTAGPEELEAIPGIGPVTARRIVAHRRRHGRFLRPDDLARVKGFTTSSVSRAKPYLRVE